MPVLIPTNYEFDIHCSESDVDQVYEALFIGVMGTKLLLHHHLTKGT
jgi:hypothetical protein